MVKYYHKGLVHLAIHENVRGSPDGVDTHVIYLACFRQIHTRRDHALDRAPVPCDDLLTCLPCVDAMFHDDDTFIEAKFQWKVTF